METESPKMDKGILEAIVKKKYSDRSISSILCLEARTTSQQGENYCSTIISYKLKLVLRSGETFVKNLIFKGLPPSEETSTFLQGFSFFKNEIEMYAKVTENMRKLMDEFEDRREKLWCEMLSYKPYDMLILEDIRDENFFVKNRKENLDFDHSALIMRTLARFHAMSRVLYKRSVICETDFPSCNFAKPLITTLCFVSSLTVLQDAVKKSWGDEWKHLPAILGKAKQIAIEKMAKLVEYDQTRFNVQNHGDCWTNNILFKQVEGTQTPCAVKFIDFQITHFNSFGWDLTYFMYMSIRPDIRRARYMDLLKIYQQALSDNLKFFKYEDDDVPTFQAVVEEMNRMKFFAFSILTSLHAVTTSDHNDAFDVEKTLKNLDNPHMGINENMYIDAGYRESVGDDFKNFIKDGIV